MDRNPAPAFRSSGGYSWRRPVWRPVAELVNSIHPGDNRRCARSGWMVSTWVNPPEPPAMPQCEDHGGSKVFTRPPASPHRPASIRGYRTIIWIFAFGLEFGFPGQVSNRDWKLKSKIGNGFPGQISNRNWKLKWLGDLSFRFGLPNLDRSPGQNPTLGGGLTQDENPGGDSGWIEKSE